MNEVPFKNLAAAREEYVKLCQELAAAKELSAQAETLEADNSDLKTQLETIQKSLSEATILLSSRVETISVQDEQIKQLKAEVDLLNVKCADLAKNQKSVQAQARELVAASAGPPAPVDNSEMEMTQDDIAKAMRAETDSKRLNALYRQFKAQQGKK
jgi:chromosome segregation ATPase